MSPRPNSGSAESALRNIVGNNFSVQKNGSMEARNVDMGGGLSASINVHLGDFQGGQGRSGDVMSIQVNGQNHSNVLDIKIEFKDR